MSKKNKNIKSEGKAKKVLGIIAAILITAFVIGVVAVSEIYNSGIVQSNTSAAVSANYKVSSTMMNYFFNNNYKTLTSGDNAQYLSMMGLDTSKALDTQIYNGETTWYDYFVDYTKSQVKELLILCEAAKADGYELSKEDKEQIKAELKELETVAKQYGFNSLDTFLKANYGAKEKDVRKCMELSRIATNYSQQVVDSFKYTDEDITNYYEENSDEFIKVDYLSYTYKYEEKKTDDLKTDETTTSADTTAESATEAATTEKAAATVDPTGTTADEKKEEPKDYTEVIAKADALYDAATDEEAFLAHVRDYLRNDVYGTMSDEALEKDEIDIDAKVEACKTTGYQKPSTETDLSKWLLADERAVGDKYKDYNENNGTFTVYMILGAPEDSDYDHACKYRDSYNAADYAYIYVPASDYKDDMEKALDAANSILKEYEADKTEENFLKLESSDKYGSDTGLIKNAIRGALCDAVDEWAFSADRKEGEAAVLESEDGYYVMYYAGSQGVVWQLQSENSLRSADYSEAYEGYTELYSIDFMSKGLSLMELVHESH